jgi:hypothetical protein
MSDKSESYVDAARALRHEHVSKTYVTEGKPRPQCVYPACVNTVRTRGLCHGHYQGMRAKVRAGKANEADLMKRRLLMPKGQGGSKINGLGAFDYGSRVRGDA